MTGVVTVADLLSRHAPAPVLTDDEDDVTRVVDARPKVEPEVEEATQAVSVGSLLRREGRAPHAVDRPIEPPAHQQASGEPDEKPATARRGLARPGVIAAGSLLAAGSVFGAAVLSDVASTGGTDEQDPSASGSYPGQGLLDPDSPLTPAAGPVQVDQAAVSNPLDPGAAAPTSWVPIAFPSALAAVPTGTAAAAATDAATGGAGGSGASTDSGLGSSAGTGGTSDTRTSGTGGGSNAGSSSNTGGAADTTTPPPPSSDSSGSGDQQSVVGELGETVGDTTDAVGGVVTGLLGGSDSGDDTESSAETSSSESSDSDDVPSSSSAPQDEGSSDDGGSDGLSGGLLKAVGDLASGLLR